MPQRLSRENSVYAFDKSAEPAMRVRLGEPFIIETYDARRGRLQRKDQVMSTAPDWSSARPQVNPCAGPVYVDGVKAGDTLKINVRRIDVERRGVTLLKREMGICKELVAETEAFFGEVCGDMVALDCGVSVPLRPHVGTLGAAPAGDSVPTAFAGTHGGNMDCRFLDAGAELYLPVFADGALISAGDVHASMGAGELMGAGIDINAEVELSVEKIEGIALGGPVVVSGGNVIAVASDPDLRGALKKASAHMVSLLTMIGGYSPKAALCLLSAVCDAGICQACDEGLFSVASVTVDVKYLKSFFSDSTKG